MISSIPMTEMPSGKIIQIHVDDETLFKIAEEVSKNEQNVSVFIKNEPAAFFIR